SAPGTEAFEVHALNAALTALQASFPGSSSPDAQAQQSLATLVGQVQQLDSFIQAAASQSIAGDGSASATNSVLGQLAAMTADLVQLDAATSVAAANQLSTAISNASALVGTYGGPVAAGLTVIQSSYGPVVLLDYELGITAATQVQGAAMLSRDQTQA